MEAQAKQLRRELPLCLNWPDLHEGILCWVHYKQGWPPLYPSVAAMPCETAQVFLYMLRSERAASDSDEMLQVVLQAQSEEWERLTRQMK